MKIAIVGPGIMSIPPRGWGAVESLIWDYTEEIINCGHEVEIINTSNKNEIIDKIKNINPDFVHIQYDEYYDIVNHIACPSALTSHFGYIEQPLRWDGYYNQIIMGIKNSRTNIFALSEGIAKVFNDIGVSNDKIFLTPNGARGFNYSYYPTNKDQSICLAKIEPRKRQVLLEPIAAQANLFFAGNIAQNDFRKTNYLGEWTKEQVYTELTNFGNLILLSDGEAAPLAVVEGLMAGLGVVISEWATANLDLTKDFITVIPENKMKDLDYVASKIIENRNISVNKRDEIRKYARDNFSWSVLVPKYLDIVENLCKK